MCAHSQKSHAYVAVNCGLNTGRHPAATLEPPRTTHHGPQHRHTNRATQQQLPKFGPASKDHHAIDKYEGQFPQYKPLWPPATCQQRGPPRCTSTTTTLRQQRKFRATLVLRVMAGHPGDFSRFIHPAVTLPHPTPPYRKRALLRGVSRGGVPI